MAKTEKEDRQEEKHDGNSSVPTTMNAPKKEDAIEHKNATEIKKQQEQEQIQPPPVLKATIVIKEDKYSRKNIWVQSTLAGVGIFTLLAFIVFGILQHQDSINNLKWARESADSGAKDTRKSLAIAESSLVLTRESNETAERGLNVTKRNMFLTTEISQTAIQPFLFADSIGEIQNLIIGEIPYNEYEITNVGATPAYRVNTWSMIMFESEFNQDSLNMATSNKPETGFFIGSKKTTGIIKSTFHNDEIWKSKDAFAYTILKKPILFITVIAYEDAFGKPHFTQQGRRRTIDKSWTELSKYTKTDHDKKTKTNK